MGANVLTQSSSNCQDASSRMTVYFELCGRKDLRGSVRRTECFASQSLTFIPSHNFYVELHGARGVRHERLVHTLHDPVRSVGVTKKMALDI